MYCRKNALDAMQKRPYAVYAVFLAGLIARERAGCASKMTPAGGAFQFLQVASARLNRLELVTVESISPELVDVEARALFVFRSSIAFVLLAIASTSSPARIQAG